MKHLGSKELLTQRLILRKIVKEDAKEIFEGFINQENFLYYANKEKRTLEEEIQSLDKIDEKYQRDDYFNWIITLKDNNAIIGSINASKLRKMYDSLKRQSTFIPVAREHINTKVDVEPQLNLTAQTEYNLRRNAEMNTTNAKVARQQARAAALDRIRQDNVIYSDKYNKEAQLRNAEAELQTRYNLVDAENKLTDIREQNDFDMQKAIGKANASTMEAQTWGNAIASTLGNTATSLMDYATMKNDLLKSNNPAAYEEKFKFKFGHLKNKLNNPKWVAKNRDWIDANIGMIAKLGWAKSNMKGNYDKGLLPYE